MQAASASSPGSGGRRRRLAAMAGTVYRAGVAAASELREQYNSASAGGAGGSREIGSGGGSGGGPDDDIPPSIPDAFPEVPFATGGDAQMVLFPMYAKTHTRRSRSSAAAAAAATAPGAAPRTGGASLSDSDEDNAAGPGADRVDNSFWHREFARLEDEKAVVDVYVHGWLYLAPQGPLSRKGRMLLALARRLSGVPAPAQWVPVGGGAAAGGGSDKADAEDPRVQQSILQAAQAIDRVGHGETEIAMRGGYSETPEKAASYDDDDDDDAGAAAYKGGRTPPPPPGPGKLTPRTSWAASIASGLTGTGTGTAAATASANGGAQQEMTPAELAAANANLLARLGPFLTTAVAQQPVTLFFYNDRQSQSRTVVTTDAGHFSLCAALDFVPTHVRVLATGGGPGSSAVPGGGPDDMPLYSALTQPLSAVAPIALVGDRGISLISDIDDTVKDSNIAGGTRVIFRNTFVRDLAAMAVDGVRDWYGALHALGVQFHYCSNSPWQLFPMLAAFAARTGLPPGPLHLKQYSGMLQGIFEPVAERKRGTLERLLRDFPRRRFLLVGDSGEADLEVYTDLVLAHPGRVLAIFIRDVTTPDQPGYFDNNGSSSTASTAAGRPEEPLRPALPPRRTMTAPPVPAAGPVMGTLIDLDDDETAATTTTTTTTSTITGNGNGNGKRPPVARKPPPPPRPAKPLALRSSIAVQPTPTGSTTTATPPPPPPPPRRPVNAGAGSASGSGSSTPTAMASAAAASTPAPPPPPLPRRRTPASSGWDTPQPAPPPPPQQQQPQAPYNKKVDLWRRRLARAESILGPQGVALYTWRRGQDVMAEAVGIVQAALAEEQEDGGRPGRRP